MDATRKPDRAPAPAPAALPTEALAALLGERWHSPRARLLLVGVDKTERPVRETFEAIWGIAPEVSIVALDSSVDVRCLPEAAWRTLGNVDWRRDILVRGGPVDHFAGDGPRGQIGIDATSKGAEDGHSRGWPQEIAMSEEIVRLVDGKWADYGIGP